MTRDKNRKREPRQISVRGTTYDRLLDAARKNGEQLSTFADALIVAWLNEREGN